MTATTHAFQAEVTQLLKLMIHSLYSNKEIFLRELVSNASDACDKLRFEGLQNPDLLTEGSDFEINLSVDKEAGTITVTDNGIGMSHTEIAEFLGTIAGSGTREYLARLTGDQQKDAQLIGQFGVGFYSAFVVAKHVTVDSLRAGEDKAVRWSSDGSGQYAIEDSDYARRGTRITLTLRDDEQEFLEPSRLQFIVKRYSDHIGIPIRLQNEEGEFEVINDSTALWQRPKNEIEDQQYKDLYQSIAHAIDEPLAWVHNRVEGKYDYTSLYFIPTQRPYDLYEREQQHGVKLFIQRVFILEDKSQLLPRYLRFVRGLVDSNDLPLNVSRELLQSNRTVDAIRSGSTKKILGLLTSIARDEPEKYQKFWDLFGAVLKEGIVEDQGNQAALAGLLRFASTHNDSLDETTSLSDYVGRMKSAQKEIYYMIADSKTAASTSPHIEGLRKRGYEVLLLGDRIDEWLVTHLSSFEDHPLRSVAHGDLDLDDEAGDKESQQQLDEQYRDLLARIQSLLAERVEEVRLSSRLVDSPSCVVAQEGAPSGFLKSMLEQAGQAMPEVKPVLEINPSHPLIVRMNIEKDKELFRDYASLVFEQAILAEGGQLKDPAAFVQRMNQVILAVSS
ncbi:MAG: molecular chaperone HtpG [Gammaproteobacteria bacterium]|nr:molecular chaperone HtpG [Gammaproteobacteria bacterium]